MRLYEALQILDEASLPTIKQNLDNIEDMLKKSNFQGAASIMSRMSTYEGSLGQLKVKNFTADQIGELKGQLERIRNSITQNKNKIKDQDTYDSAIASLDRVAKAVEETKGQEQQVSQQQVTKKKLGTAPAKRKARKPGVVPPSSTAK